MELAVAASSAATVVQLIDFSGSLLKSTISFMRSVTKAPKEIAAVHARAKDLETLFGQVRLVAVEYMDAPELVKGVIGGSFEI
jgi:hypothetical protein